MKILRFSILLSFVTFYCQAQVGIGTENPNPKSVLDLRSQGNNQGFLVPRLTTLQRTATSFTSTLSNTEKGLLIFDTDINKFYYWNGADWTIIEDSTGTDSQTLSFNSATGLLSITGGNNVNLTGTSPGGTAGGDLTGAYPNPTIANNAITSAKILDGTITNADINNAASIAVNKISGGTNGQVLLTSGTTPTWSAMPPPSGVAGGDLTGAYPSPTVANNAITTAKILDGTVATSDIANAAITDAKVSTGIAPAKLVAGTAGQVLTTVAGVPTWSTPSVGGTVTNIITGTGLTGGPITTSGTIALANTTVSSGSYGSLTQMPQLTIDAQGRITNATNLAITGFPPNGAASGDLTGTYPNPAVANGAITSAKILDGTVATVDIANLAVNDSKIASGVAVNKLSGGTNGQVLTTSGTTPIWATPADNSATNELQNIANVLGQGNDAGGQNVINLKSVSINTSATTGALNVLGSQFVGFTPVPTTGAVYNITSSDYVVYGAPQIGIGSMNINLPSADPNKGRVLIIRTSGTNANKNVVIVRPSGTDTLDGGAGIQLDATLGRVYSIMIISVGNDWQTLSKSVY